MRGDLPSVLEKTLGRLAVEQLLPAKLKASMQEALHETGEAEAEEVKEDEEAQKGKKKTKEQKKGKGKDVMKRPAAQAVMKKPAGAAKGGEKKQGGRH